MNLRPVMDYVSPNETEEERIQIRLSDFAKCYENFTKIIANNQPFYPKEIFDELIDLSHVMYGEAVDYKHSKVTQRDLDNYWKKAEENQTKIIDSIDRIGELIRMRVSLE